MPFLLAFWKPIAILLAVATLAAFAGIEKHRYDERRRDEGRAEIQAKWEAAIAAQRTREIAAAKEADDFQRRADAKREADFRALLGRRTAERDAALTSERIGAATVAELRNAIRTANSQGAGSAAPDAAPITGLTVADWFTTVAQLYRACREQVAGWIAWDDERVKQ